MTVGNKRVDSMLVNGMFFNRNWSGGNDPVNHKVEQPYTAKMVNRANARLTEYSEPSHTVFSTGFPSYEINETKPTWDNNSELELLGKVTDALREHRFNAGIFGAEFHKALDSVVSSSLTVFNAYRHARRGNFAEAWRSFGRTVSGAGVRKGRDGRWHDTAPSKAVKPEEIAQTWLAMQYAWKPLLTDIYEAMEWIHSKTSLPREVQIRCRKAQKPVTVNDATVGANYSFLMKWSVWGELRVTLVESISVARSLGLLNPTSVAWELVPFSFVVDWFIPIGNYLDAIGFLGGLNLRYGRTMKYLSEGTKKMPLCRSPTWPSNFPQFPHSQYCHPDWVNQYPKPSSWRIHQCDGVYRRVVWVDRTQGTTLSVPTPRPKALEKALSLGHIQNAAALIWSGWAKTQDEVVFRRPRPHL